MHYVVAAVLSEEEKLNKFSYFLSQARRLLLATSDKIANAITVFKSNARCFPFPKHVQN